MSAEQIILVDEHDREIGSIEKLAAHQNGGKLHRAFSIFVFNSKGEMLIQMRALGKHHWAGIWTNTCCSHPHVGETLEQAVHRRLKEEFGFDCNLKEIFAFIYKATDSKSGLTEWEFDHFFIGIFDGTPKPNPEEIGAYKWVKPEELKKDIAVHPEKYTPWFKASVDKVIEYYNKMAL